ncbi:nicotinamidase [Coprothermobacteraceae bacterium]|nr:nicotinamidase [Coprothermobacteraceae bacterium]
MLVRFERTDALIVVDVQNDFCPGGALAVPQGDEIIPVVNRLIKKAEEADAIIVYTRDWHPKNHLSFADFGGIWPVHCVQGTPGADFHPDLYVSPQGAIVNKATDTEFEAYSGFQTVELHRILKNRGVKRVFIVGLATDYCVKETALDAIRLGYETYVIEDAVRGVNVNPDDSARALEEIRSKGGQVVSSQVFDEVR